MRRRLVAIVGLAAAVAVLLVVWPSDDEGEPEPATANESTAGNQPVESAEPPATPAQRPDPSGPAGAETSEPATGMPATPTGAEPSPSAAETATPGAETEARVPPGTETPAPRPLQERSTPTEDPMTARQRFESAVGSLYIDALMGEVADCLELMRGLDVETADVLVFNLRAVATDTDAVSVSLDSVDAAELDIEILDCFVERLDVLELPSPDPTVHDELPPDGAILRQPVDIDLRSAPD